jgi:hypothetical protein
MDDIARPSKVFFVHHFQHGACPDGNDLLGIFVAEGESFCQAFSQEVNMQATLCQVTFFSEVLEQPIDGIGL